ncbi:MAG: MerR family transcriptional regulator [Croceibacterium sp.]
MAGDQGLFDTAGGKDPGALRTIGEVAEAFGIRQHVLRYWEQQFPALRPLKRSGGRRLYRVEDVELVATIDRLVNREGYTLKGAALAIAKGSAEAPVAAEPVPSMSAPQPDVLPQLRAIRDRLAAALAA